MWLLTGRKKRYWMVDDNISGEENYFKGILIKTDIRTFIVI